MQPRPPFTPIETPRLILRRFQEADLPSFLAYRNDPEVARYQSWDTFTEAQARTFLQEQANILPGDPTWFQYAIEARATGTLIGDCALKTDPQEPRQAEIGFTLARTAQGQGFATEALTALLEYAFSVLNLHRVIAITDCLNTPSVALLERLGLRREGHFLQNVWFKGSWGDEYLYAMLQTEWRAR